MATARRACATINSPGDVPAMVHWLLPIVALACVSSLGGFATMLRDKRRAQRGARRTSERALALWAIFGGWPGLLAGGIISRHKTRASGFKAKVVAGALVHAGIVAFLWWCDH